jgi:phage baseplate assembly protein W
MAAIYTKGLSTHTRGWIDLDLDFTKHPVTKDISTKKDVEAVKRSLRNLIQTNRYDKKFHPEIDGGVTRHLFGLSNANTKHDIVNAIRTCIKNYEPRVVIDGIAVMASEDMLTVKEGGVRISGNLDKNGFNVSIFFRVKNSPEPIEVSMFLERIR